MSSKNPVTTNNSNDNNNSIDRRTYVPNEWVEIVEPKTKQRIYANLETGICAKDPPQGATVSKSEDFTDHWWELLDQKTGKYYYYNPEQQKTAWSRPKEPASSPTTNGGSKIGKKLLIIPVSRLQTFKKVSSDDSIPDKCDATTQTIASNLVSTGTQTISGSVLEEEFNSKLRLVDLSHESTDAKSSSSSSCTHSFTNNAPANRAYLNQRQASDLNTRERGIYSRSQLFQPTSKNGLYRLRSHDSSTTTALLTSDCKNTSSQKQFSMDNQDGTGDTSDKYTKYFSPNLIQNQRERAPVMSIKSPTRFSQRNDEYMSSTSTFVNSSARPQNNSMHDIVGKNVADNPQKLVSNNLSHYLVREARAMGIALISDEELEDDDQELSEDDCVADEDEDTDLRDDLSSQRGGLNASQDLGEDSSEGWKSFSDQESPNSPTNKSGNQVQRSPILCEASASTFTFNDLMSDETNPSTSMSQQLDHRKLVENFKKSRQSSSFGLQDSLSRNYILDANQAVQKIKTAADNYFHQDRDSQMSDRHLRQLSTLSTLPRPHKKTKDKIALSKQQDVDSNLDADYDVVEENCGYYSDSERNQLNASSENTSSLIYNQKLQPTKSGLLGENINKQAQNSNFDRNKSSRGSTFSVESFARENLTRHPKKGGLLFNRKVKWSRMISWTNTSIKQPMLSSVSADLCSASISSFKLIQQFMGDRKVTINKKYRQILAQSASNEDSHNVNKVKGLPRAHSISSSNPKSNTQSNVPNIPDRLRDELAYELVVKGCTTTPIRDEIYVQMARQLTENPNQASVEWGLVLLTILLSYFSPSSKFSPFLQSFLETQPHQIAHDVCLPRLEKRLRQNWLTYCRKPVDGKEISMVRLSITKWPQYCGVFGESLDRLMTLQSCSPYLRKLRLPWILTVLGDKLIETGGAETEGIFRCAADHDLIAQLRLEIDCIDFRKITDARQVHSLLSNVVDPHVIAGLLKSFFRQLYEPVFPTSIYETCLQNGHDGHMACRVFNEHLPNLNKDIVAYLIRLLQTLSHQDKVLYTKMDNSNLSMVWAPNLLRAPEQQENPLQNNGSRSGSKWSISNVASADEIGSGGGPSATSVVKSQSMIFEQTRQEMQFIRSLIIHLDTSFIENVT